jgi:hypothetical protein
MLINLLKPFSKPHFMPCCLGIIINEVVIVWELPGHSAFPSKEYMESNRLRLYLGRIDSLRGVSITIQARVFGILKGPLHPRLQQKPTVHMVGRRIYGPLWDVKEFLEGVLQSPHSIPAIGQRKTERSKLFNEGTPIPGA